MSKKWKNLSIELQSAEERHFEIMSLPFIRAIWNDAIQPQPLKSTYDRSGIDIVLWTGKNTTSIKLAVQCKGFKVKEHQLGKSQIRQCKESIEVFRKSGLTADTYILLHNRIPNNLEFREEVQREVESLKASGQVKKAYVWGYQKLLQEAGKKIGQRCEKLLRLKNSNIHEFITEPLQYAPLERVPVSVSELTISPTTKISELELFEDVIDPSKELLTTGVSNLCLVLAHAGYGKTTTALRTVSQTDKKVYYLSAAKLPPNTGNKDSLIKQLINTDELWVDAVEEDIPILEKLVSPQIDRLLRKKDTQVVLILDALDESLYFNRQGGIQQLFNHIRDYKVPVVLLARSEFWMGKQIDFATSYGTNTLNQDKQVRRPVKVIRLLDWQDEQIKELSLRYRQNLSKTERTNVDDFIKLLEFDRYREFYGDIPKRPLFMRYILDSVAEQGIKQKGKARLFYDWVELKIRRDVFNPVKLGGEGRAPILSDVKETETTIRLAFRAMKTAAGKMISIYNNNLELNPSCDIEEITSADEKLKLVLDPTGLFLHTLLIPIRFSPEKLEIGFAHRTFHEFFLALFIRDNPDLFSGISLPEVVKNHLGDIALENI